MTKPLITQEDLDELRKIEDPKKRGRALERMARKYRLAPRSPWAPALLLGGVAVAICGALLCARTASADTSRVNALAEAAVLWQPMRTRDLPTISEIAEAAVAECGKMRKPFPTAAKCPAFYLALLFRESSWYPNAVGRLQERGLGQLRPMAWRGLRPEQVHEIDTNVGLVAQWLELAQTRCRRHERKRDYPLRVVHAYGSGDCRPSRSARMVMRWADRIHYFELGAALEDRR